MSYSKLLVHTATIERRTPGKDRFGQPLTTWQTVRSGVKCRLTNPSGRTQFSAKDQGTVHVDHTLYFEKDVQIGEGNRIGAVYDAGGTKMAGPLMVLLQRPVSTRDGMVDHMEVPCQLFREVITA